MDFESSACGQACPNQLVCHSLQILKKEIKDEVHFLHADKHQRFLQVHFNILGIKVSYKVILSLIGVDKHSQITQTSLLYL